MKIIIIGATQVGTELAEYLVQAGHAVTLIDNPSTELTQIANRLDLRVVQGDPTWPSVLREAGARNTELLVATAPNDEINIATCSVAAALFSIPRKIARIRASDFLSESDKLFGPKAIPIDHIISPERIMADAIDDLMELPGVTALHSFTKDRLIITAVCVTKGGKLIGALVTDLENYDGRCKVLAVYRNGQVLDKLSTQTIEEGDEIYFCAERTRTLNLIGALMPLKPNGKNVVIQGGSHIADAIAIRLSKRYNVKLIEPDPERAERISPRFKDMPVELYCAEASNIDFVLEEKLYHTDTFIAAAPSEESNIMASLLIQRMNKVRTIAIIRQPSLQDIAQAGNEINAIVSPRESVISALLSNILQEGVERMRIFRQGQAEALELLVQGNKRSSNVVGRKIEDLNIPAGVHFGLALRDKLVVKIDENFIFEDGDRVVTFLTDRMQMRNLIKLFKPRAFWLPHW